jgi:phage/plasmid-associated DNA primase
MNTNSLPVSPDKSKGFYRRWLIIDFPHEFRVGKDILAEIPEEEYENLAFKCINICKRLLDNRAFTNEGDIPARIKRYEDRSNPMMRYIEDHCDEEPDKYMVLKDFVNKLNDYLKDNRLRTLTVKAVAKNLREDGFEVKGRRVTVDDQQVQTTCVYGLNIIENSDENIQKNLAINLFTEHSDRLLQRNEIPFSDEILDELKSKGYIYEPRDGFFRLI